MEQNLIYLQILYLYNNAEVVTGFMSVFIINLVD